MIKTYMKLAFRSLVKNKVFSFINIFGLSIGLTCCLLISMYLIKEFSYDKHQQFGNRLYQLGTSSMRDGVEDRSAHTPAPMAPVMAMELPEIESYTRLIEAFQDDKTLLQYNNGKQVNSFYETRGFFADSTFFRLFSYDFIEGDPKTALNEPNGLVLSSEIAEKIFGNKPALNQTLHINSNTNGEYDFKVSGVFRPSIHPSHIDARFFMSMKSGEMGPWVSSITDMVNNNMFYSYLLLKPGAAPEQLQAKFEGFINKHAGDDLRASGRNRKQYLTAVKDIHLHATDGNVTPGGSLSYLYILMSIAIVTLLIACVNFMNLSTARSSKRAVEIGVRKVLGAEKKSLIRQFLWEAILLSFVSFLFAIFFTWLLRPLFERVSDRQLTFGSAQYGWLLVLFLVVTLLAGLIAGLYPAFYLSAFKPVKVLKGRFSNSLAAINFRKVLVVFQFVISVALIVGSVTINDQMRYLRNKELGFSKDQQLIIPLRTTNAKSIYTAFKAELANQPFVINTGASIYYPGIRNSMDWLLYKQGNTPDQNKDVFINQVDNSYLQTLGIKLVAGRLFSPDFPSDTADRMILNEQAVKEFGFASASEALGKNIISQWGNEVIPRQIIGVVQDFHFQDLHNKIESYGFLLNRRPSFDYVIAHLKAGTTKQALATITALWTRLNPNEPFEFSFLDQDFQKNYAAEDRLAAIIRYFTIIAICISCLGLFGLTTFSIEQRTREIGIRKVLGASSAGIVGLLSKDFLKLVFLSFFVAAPIAWYFMHNWLQSFAYRAPFSIWIILTACCIALLIAFLTISIQSVKVALTNPVKTLRSE
ncbi:MAG TPA: ABC transporter permease [Flavisolibacter sp.]|nr:ABC transporter permease [Flavisolibacter sp.]